MKNEQVESIISQLVRNMNEEFEDSIRNMKLDDTTINDGANTPIKSTKLYNFGTEEQRSYIVESFGEIGWPDPFPRPLPKGRYSAKQPPHLNQEKL